MNNKLLPIYLLSLANVLNFSIVIPVLPGIVDAYHGNAIVYGLLASVYSAFQLIATPLLGELSDHYGRRPMLIISNIGTLLSWAIFAAAAFVPNQFFGPLTWPLYLILLSRIVDGITGGNISITTAYITDVIKPEDRAKVFGTMGAIFGVGMILGPVIGGLAAATAWGYLATVAIVSTVSFVTVIVMYAKLSESLVHPKQMHLGESLISKINITKKIAKYSHEHGLDNVFRVRIWFGVAFTVYVSVIMLYMKDSYNLNEQQLGLAMLVIGSYMVINQGFLVQKITPKLGEKNSIYVGHALMILGFLGNNWAPNIWAFLGISYLINAGLSLNMPSLKALLTRPFPPNQQGEVAGVDEGINAAANAVVPVLAGVFYQFVSHQIFYASALIAAWPFISSYLQRGTPKLLDEIPVKS